MKLPRILLYHVDVLNDEYISGWAFNRVLPDSKLKLTFHAGGDELGSVRCALERDDVRQSGLHATGRCGFEYRFPRRLKTGVVGDFVIRAGALPVPLLRRPLDAIQSAVVPERPIFFMHIPKTAGTSFNNHVHSWFGHGRWHSHIEVLPESEQAALLSEPQYVAGHLPFHRLHRLGIELDGIDLHTIFRDPLRQVHSHLAWIKGIGADADAAFFHAHPPVVRELALSLQSEKLDNADGLAAFSARIDGFQCDFFDNIQVRYLLDHRPERVGEDDLANALASLDRFKTFGVTERYQEYLAECAAFYGRRHIAQQTRHNPSRVAPMFDMDDPAIRAALQPLITHDQVLYDRALAVCAGRS